MLRFIPDAPHISPFAADNRDNTLNKEVIPLKSNIAARRGLILLLFLALLGMMSLPSSAFFWNKKGEGAKIISFSKNGLLGEVITFTAEDFALSGGTGETLAAITVTALPDPGTGELTVGGQPVTQGTVIQSSALAGLRFQIAPSPTQDRTAFSFLPVFTSGAQGAAAEVTLYLLNQENHPPIARNMELSTYKNVSITGYFDAVDAEGDVLTFQLTSTPARGAVTLAEDGSSQFVYTPYENKTGRDIFTYVAADTAGNTSPEATITVQITKPDTQVTYADLEGSPAHKAAIRLAEEGLYVGRQVDGQYLFEEDRPVSRDEFLALAVAAAELSPLEDITITGFFDDQAIPTWAKGSVAAALKAGAIRGCSDESGAPVFQPERTVTFGEATVMLNNLLSISDVPAQVFAPDSGSAHWAGQAAANLAASGVIRTASTVPSALAQSMTLGDAAQLLDGALDLMAARQEKGLF